MKFSLIILVLFLQAGNPPAPGNPGHKEPIPSVSQSCNLNRAGRPVDAAHACECHHICAQNLDSSGEPKFGMHVVENAKCRWWCFPKYCKCPIENCE